MVEQLSSLHALHHYEHVLQRLKVVLHHDYVRVVETANDLYFFPQKLPLPGSQLLLVDDLLGEELLSLLRSAFVNCAEFAFPQLMQTLVLLRNVKVACL